MTIDPKVRISEPMTAGRELPPAPGLQRAGARLPLDEYLHRLWGRRWFMTAYATASNSVGYERSFLGQIWQVLTPVLNIVVYYLIFGLLLRTNRGVPNYIPFLSIGVFFFAFSSSALTAGAKSITGNLGLVRALQFPRAVLPISTMLIQLIQLMYSLVVLVPILMLSGVMPSFAWIQIVPVLVLQTLFCLGLAFTFARIGARIPDTTQLLPFVTRVWMYTSGVMYSIQVFTQGHPQWVVAVLTYNPGSVYLELARHAFLPNNPAPASVWFAGLVWAFGLATVGFLYFWRGEEEYGNV